MLLISFPTTPTAGRLAKAQQVGFAGGGSLLDFLDTINTSLYRLSGRA
ncbi:hypothetical protein RBI21_11840 [Klebsiella pneumoniae]|nr:hypothetical protein RBI21_11840 [Klebsiella pneumoniae]